MGGAAGAAGPAGVAGVVTGRCTQLAMTFGRKPPIVRVCFDREDGEISRDSGYLLVFSDAGPPEELTPDRVEWLCLNCVIDEFPEVGSGLHLARMHGEVALDESGLWVPLGEEP